DAALAAGHYLHAHPSPPCLWSHGAAVIVDELPEGQRHHGGHPVPGPHQAPVLDHPADIGEADRAQAGVVDHAAELAGAAAVVGDQVGPGGGEGGWAPLPGPGGRLEPEAGQAALDLAQVVDPGHRLLARVAAL